MTLVNIDLRNQGYETSPGDKVVFYSLLVREGDFGTISTAPVEVELTDGKASVDLAPGPVGVQIIAGQVADTRVKIGEVPPSGPTTLNAVMMVAPAYTPALQKMMIAAIERAKDTAVGQVDAEVAQAVDAEVGEFKTKAEQALTKSTAAESKSDAALSKSTTAESSAGNAVSRVEALEVMGGLAPGEPADGQTANLISQTETLTRGALDTGYVTVAEAPINVMKFGGNVQSALDEAATAVSGLAGEVYIPAGTYTGSWVVPDNVRLRGAGQRSTRLVGVGASTVLSLGRRSHVSDMYILGDRTPGGVGVKHRTGAVHITLRNLAVNGHDVGVQYDENYICQIEQSTIQACGTGVRLASGNINAIQINGGEMQNCVTGLRQEAGSLSWGIKLRTTIEGNSGNGIDLAGSSFGFSCSETYFESNAAGHMLVSGNSYGLKVSGGLFLNRAAYGIRISGDVVEDPMISENLFNLNGEGNPRAIYGGAGVKGLTVKSNHYIGGSKGKFDPIVDYLGTGLSWESGGKHVLRRSEDTASRGGASLRIPHGLAPLSPVDGDIWTTSGGFFARIGGVTHNLASPPTPPVSG